MRRSSYSVWDLGAISVGGVTGAAVRWLINSTATPAGAGWFEYEPNTSLSAIGASNYFPLQTLIANLLGCLLLGGLTFALTRTPPPAPRRLMLAAATGFCGSLTTFSTFAVETAELLRGPTAVREQFGGLAARYEPAVAPAILYIVLSVVAGAVAFTLGRLAAKRLAAS